MCVLVGCYLLLAAALILNIVQRIIVQIARAAIEDREKAGQRAEKMAHVTCFESWIGPLATCYLLTAKGVRGQNADPRCVSSMPAVDAEVSAAAFTLERL